VLPRLPSPSFASKGNNYLPVFMRVLPASPHPSPLSRGVRATAFLPTVHRPSLLLARWRVGKQWFGAQGECLPTTSGQPLQAPRSLSPEDPQQNHRPQPQPNPQWPSGGMAAQTGSLLGAGGWWWWWWVELVWAVAQRGNRGGVGRGLREPGLLG
jgi:hypothetical protein